MISGQPPTTSRRIGFVSTRFSGTDGVSLETSKWAMAEHNYELAQRHYAYTTLSRRLRVLMADCFGELPSNRAPEQDDAR